MPAPRDTRSPFAAVRAVLNQHDPEGLLAIGAPDDEYDPESEHFAGLLRDGQPITAAVVTAAWHHWFGDLGLMAADPNRVNLLAADLDGLR
jgi:hypothetical protein